MILPVEIYGSSVLRRVSQEIQPDYPHLNVLIENMYKTMYNADGIGLAAPQIGLNIRLLVVDLAPMADQDTPELNDFKRVFINPKILSFQGESSLFSEGCLSLPGIREDVMRPDEIEIQYEDENFVQHQVSLSGIKARVLQHEYDHIEGKLFVDHLAALKRKLINRKLQAIAKGNVKTEYKTSISK